MSRCQPPRDRILSTLASSTEGRMKRSTLKRFAFMRYSFLDRLLSELADEGKVKIDGEMVILIHQI